MRKLIGGVAVALLVGAPIRSASSELKLTLLVYNHAHVSDEVLGPAEKSASQIFDLASVRLIWRDGFAYAAERQKFEIPPPEDSASLVVKLQPESERARYGVRSECEGIGLPSGAIVFVRHSDKNDSASAATRVAYVIAHELGHILLGPNAHSVVGIMRGTLIQQDWDKAAQGTLGFTRSQAGQIRMWIV